MKEVSYYFVKRIYTIFIGGFYLICLNEFESATHLLLMYTEDTKRWLEMMSMAFEEYHYLRSNSINEFGGKFI